MASGTSAAGPPCAHRARGATRPNKWLVTVSITFGTLMGAIDSSIVSVALPHMMGTLGATVQEITWISTGYIIANVVVMPFTAFLGRLFGQKRVYMTCLVLFLLGSILCGTARTLPALIVYRVLQGFGAGALQPTEQAILRQTFPPRSRAWRWPSSPWPSCSGPALGPTLGGWIVDNYAWPWIFYINVPVGHPRPGDGGGLRPRGRGHRREEPRPGRRAAQGHRLVGHRPARRGPVLAAVRARGGAAGRLVPVARHHPGSGRRSRSSRRSSCASSRARCPL